MAVAVAPLNPLHVLRDVARVYAARWLPLTLGAIAVYTPLAAVDAAIEHAGDYATFDIAIEQATAQTATHLFGDVVYAGLVAAAVVTWRSGQPRTRALDIVRALPWWTLIVLDLVMGIGTAIGIVLFVAPGVWFAVRYGLSPAAAEVEHRDARAALQRSAELVRGRFWRVAAVLVPITATGAVVEQLLQARIEPFGGDLLASLAVQVMTGPFLGLATVLLLLELREPAAQPGRG